jgi:hypothetical protein
LPFGLKETPVGSVQDLGCFGAVIGKTGQPRTHGQFLNDTLARNRIGVFSINWRSFSTFSAAAPTSATAMS